MSRSVTGVLEENREQIENALAADFDCVYKTQQVDGSWTVTGCNLALGVNEQFRPMIIEAAERTGVLPFCLAALIDIEAAKDQGVWDVNSQNPHSTARGLTQFVRGTWLDMARRAGTFLNGVAQQRGFIDVAGDVTNEAALLDLRVDAECSIMTAADYGMSNLQHLMAQGFVATAASDEEKARAMYLAHHDGLGGAVDWFAGRVDEASAQQKLISAAGADQAARLKTPDHSWGHTYLTWIFSKVRPEKFGS